MVGVRVPFLNPSIWRYALDDAGTGAMLWRGERGEVAAFNMVHRSGTEGWMGHSRCDRNRRARGSARTSCGRGSSGCGGRARGVIGLETMPRTMDNIGFYSIARSAAGSADADPDVRGGTGRPRAPLLGRLPLGDRDDVVAECRALLGRLLSGL